ncbi:unnamed protein product [Linum tenue]|uniref:FAF domain-containing protein n=1 Tax=Linum tenue TaxID=586396 RepID=A0AAV0QG23_9ROSI|nr:unnamed protein product [Linum tenue]
MSSSLSRSFGGLSASLNEEVMVTSQKQGIISLLPTGCSSPAPPPPPLSLRRTLSADMSSNTWLNRNSSSAATLKKIASSNELRLAADEPEPRDPDQAAAGLFDTWSAIMSAQKGKEDDGGDNPPPPYIHPLVRQSKSCLSEKSLEICTESLGSETGCDGFSSYPGSESGENEEEVEAAAVEEAEEENRADPPPVVAAAAQKFDIEEEDIRIAKLNAGNLPICGVMKKSPPRSFPPPISSLSRGAATGSLLMRPHRDNGRLVLEAVSFASQNNFRAQREDGRLVLTFVPDLEEKSAEIASDEQQFEVELDNSTETLETEEEEEDEIEMEEEEEEEEEEVEFVKEEAPKLTSGPMSVHRLAVMMNKPISRNPTWPKQVAHHEEEAEVVTKAINHPLTQSLPPRPPRSAAKSAATKTAAAATNNPYECYWKSSSKLLMPTSAVAVAAAAAELVGPITQNSAPTKNVNINDATKIAPPSSMEKGQLLEQRRQGELVVKRGGDHFVPWIKGCKEPRRSLLFWEPHCIATT